MFKYAQIDNEGNIVCLSCLSGKVESINMIQVDSEFHNTDLRYDSGKWIESNKSVRLAIEDTNVENISNTELVSELNTTYELAKRLIVERTCDRVDIMRKMDMFLMADRLSYKQYEELFSLLDSQEG